MREAISGTTLFMIVIFFVVLFTGYLCMSINQNKAFAVKNAIVRVVERNGVGKADLNSLINDSKFREEISQELAEIKYHTKGICTKDSSNPEGWVGLDVEGNLSNTPSFCIAYTHSKDTDKGNPSGNLHYFKIKTFYQFDIPVLRTVFDLAIEGTTKPMM